MKIILLLFLSIPVFCQVRDCKDYIIDEKSLLQYAKDGNVDGVLCALDMGINIESRDKDEWTPLHLASASGKIEVVKILLSKGANIESKTNHGASPLVWAASEGRLDTIKFLLSKGADLESRTNFGNTPLTEASYDSKVDVVKYLLSVGANKKVRLLARFDKGKTACDVAGTRAGYGTDAQKKATKEALGSCI